MPDELTTRLNWKAGDIVSLDETASGVTLSKPQTEFEYQLEVGRRVMRERRGVLSALAKSDTEHWVQNRKYRCVIGSDTAGSHTSKIPSACTA